MNRITRRVTFSVAALVGSILIVSGIATANAGDLGPIEEAHETFNRAARDADLEIRLTPISCSADKARVCMLKLNGKPGAMISSGPADHSRAADLTVVLGSSGNPADFLAAMVVSMIAWSPGSSADVRGKAIKELLAGVKAKKRAEVIVGPTRYKILPLDLAGLWFIAEAV